MKYLIPIYAILLCIGCKKETSDTFSKSLDKLISSQPGQFAVSYYNLDNGDTFEIHADTIFHAASTMKTPVMIELYKQSDEGKFKMTDSIRVVNQFRSIVDSSEYSMDIGEDSEETLYSMIGKREPIFYLMEEMITKSSNLATNILIQKVGASNVTQTMRTYGADKIQVLRGVEDIKAYDAGLSNTTTSHDLMMIYKAMANGETVNEQASKEMIEILSQQHWNEMIPAELPKDVVVAHKTGNITGVAHDSGIVFLPDGSRYVLVILSKNLPDVEVGTKFIADLSKKIYDFHIKSQ